MAMAIYYLTAHCLVDGIVEVDTATTETAGMYSNRPRTRLSGTGDAVKHYRKTNDWISYRYDIGKGAFKRREDAVADAEKRRAKKLASLRKQIAKLEALEF